MNIEKAIKKAKTKLIREAKTKGLYENFGQREVREIRNMFSLESDTKTIKKIKEFDNWCQTYTG